MRTYASFLSCVAVRFFALSFPSLSASDLLSVGAIFLTIFTLYWTVLRGAKLLSPTPRVVGLIAPYGGAPMIGTTIFLTNAGARSAMIDFLSLDLIAPDLKEYRFHCVFEVPFRKLQNGELKATQETHPRPFSLPSGAAVTKDLVFVAETFSRFVPGSYRIGILVVQIGQQNATKVATLKIRVNKELLPGNVFEGVAFAQVEEIQFG